ncbi:MAG: aminopeptidase N [Burkholderiales bacterium]|nr:aminopeptidase N [Burkholderiales bacterium]OJX05045.1 MAG: aminopeptidase N [Burkholderiales bacterium 70-64]
MRTDQPVTIRRTDYTPPAFLVDEVRLEFDLDPQRTRVHALLSVRRNPALPGAGNVRTPLVLNGEQLKLVDLRIDGRPLEAASYRIADDTLTVPEVPERFVLATVSYIDPSANAALSGLYVSNGNLFTQCEAEGFRRITWFPDRPDVMARYTVTLRAPRERFPVLLSNGNLVAAGECEPLAGDGIERRGWHWATWEDPFPKPSYLFALVAGRLVATEQRLRTRSGREVLLQVWTEPGNEARTGHAMASLERAIRWDEQRFGLELDLDRFMIVAVDDFNMGAMENKGLNIFNTKYVFADPRIATDQDFAAIESVVGHEYFHNWTGNRVTCRDWFQLTLKEGLTVFRDQEFSADMMAARSPDPAAAASARAVKRIEDVRVLRAAQFPEDAGPMAHPIRPDSYQQINNFYTVTVYEKGAEVIRMLQTLVGRDGFRRGMDLYFRRHDGQAVTCDDFVAAIGDANGVALERFARWYAQAGTPRVRVTARYDAPARRYALELEQHCPPSPGQPRKEPLHVPFAAGLVGPDGRDCALHVREQAGDTLRPATARIESGAGGHTVVLELTEPRHVFWFEDVGALPVPSLARNLSAPVIVEYDYDDAQLAFLAAHDSDPFNRWEATQRLAVNAVLAIVGGADARECCGRLAGVLRGLLDDATLDAAFRDQLFILPSEGFIAEQLAVVDPAALRAARNALRRRIADELSAAWQPACEALRDDAPYTPEPAAAGRRALKNTLLGWWTETQAGAAVEAAALQSEHADNMTDLAGALQALLRVADPRREAALAHFAQRYAGEPLALDKWFSMQATMHRHPGEAPVLKRVRALMGHPAFSLRNPNRVRALVGSFCNGNLAEFHAADGSGYAFWREQVLAIDAFNPQVAARLARALDRWRKFSPDRQALMRAALEQVAAHEPLSGDVREIVTKALAA